MKDYQRLTVKNVGRYTQIKDDYSTFDCLRRLAELEDKIENGTLIEAELPCTNKKNNFKYRLVADYHEEENKK